jgi:hypothetical protein
LTDHTGQAYHARMPLSPYQRKNIEALKERARQLYQQGLTTRAIGAQLGKSHTWVADAVKPKKSRPPSR